MVPAVVRLKQRHQAGNDPIFRHATALLIIHTPQNSNFGCEDANLAYQNGSLMANSQVISQIYMGFILRAIKQGHQKAFSQLLGVDGKVQAIMALGIPAFQYPKYSERNG